MEKESVAKIDFFGVTEIELLPLQESGGSTWHTLKVNGYDRVTFFTNGKDLVPHVLDKEALSTDSSGS